MTSYVAVTYIAVVVAKSRFREKEAWQLRAGRLWQPRAMRIFIG